MRIAKFLFGLALIVSMPSVLQAQRCFPPQPLPTGATGRPAEMYDAAEYNSTVGSVPFQGNLAPIKSAPVMSSLFGGGVANFQTWLIINNPSRTSILSVIVEQFDPAGNLVDTYNTDIPPNGNEKKWLTELEQAGNAFGMVRVRVTAASTVRRFAGVTVYSADEFANPFDTNLETFVSEFPLASVQPLQELQRFQTRVSFGPIPARLRSNKDVLNGNFSFFNIINPTQNALQIVPTISTSSGAASVTLPAVAIAPNGSAQVYDLWIRAIADYTSGSPDEDLTLTLVESNNNPFISEGLILDLLSDEDAGMGGTGGQLLASDPTVGTLPAADPTVGTLPATGGGIPGDIDPEIKLDRVGGRARMTSIMPASSTAPMLICPEVTDLDSVELGTVVAIANAQPTTATQVTAWYYDQNGNLLAKDLIGAMPQFDAAFIGLGCPRTPNFPTGQFRGFMRITRCKGDLIGYSNRFNEAEGTRQKMWGESLYGTAGNEHYPGWIDNGRQTSLIPLVLQCDDTITESNYAVAVNENTGNIGNWDIEAFDEFGMTSGTIAFAGLRSYNTAGTFFDMFVIEVPDVASALISNDTGHVKGINVIGGVLEGKLRFSKPGVYEGPGDVLGF